MPSSLSSLTCASAARGIAGNLFARRVTSRGRCWLAARWCAATTCDGADVYDIDVQDSMADDRVEERRSDRKGAGKRDMKSDKAALVPLRVGDSVRARWQGNRGGGYFDAKVVADNNDGTFSLKYEDGDEDASVPVWYKGKADPEIKHADGSYVDCKVKVARGVGVADSEHGGFKRMCVEQQVGGQEELSLGARIKFDYDFRQIDCDGNYLPKEERSVTLANIVLEKDPCVAAMHYRAFIDFMELLYTTPPVSKQDMEQLLGPTAGKGWTKSEAKRLEANFAVFKRARDKEEERRMDEKRKEEEKRSGAGSSGRKRRQ